MGKIQIRRPKTLLGQFLLTYLMILICSLVTAVILITGFYLTYHSINEADELDINSPRLSSILEFVHKNKNSLEEDGVIKQLDELAQENDLEYHLQDKNNTVHNFRNNSQVQIPIMDEKTGQIKYMLVMANYSTATWIVLTCVDAGIPFICFIVYTYIFARRFSKRIRLPLKELMGAAEKIKNKDVDFSITCIRQENEIGDLIQAFEEMRNELKNSLIKQWQLEQERRDMVAAITHDIRTPLAIIQGHVEGLEEGIKEDPQKLNDYLSVIELNVTRTKKLIDDMNTLMEIDNEGFSLYSAPVNLQEYMENKAKEIKILTDKKEIVLESKVVDNRLEKTYVCLDASRLSQIIDNLVSNSIRYTKEGGRISIITKISEGEVLFRICDTGKGFSEKDIAHLFKKFYKGDYSRSKEKGHSGLGLYITKSIVEKHGGSIKAFNLEEGGAGIEFSLKI